jgi:hypothetical protein
MIQRLAAPEICPPRLPEENVANGLLPIGKNALQLKMDNRISDFPHKDLGSGIQSPDGEV